MSDTPLVMSRLNEKCGNVEKDEANWGSPHSAAVTSRRSRCSRFFPWSTIDKSYSRIPGSLTIPNNFLLHKNGFNSFCIILGIEFFAVYITQEKYAGKL